MENEIEISRTDYTTPIKGVSVTGNLVEVIGERVVELEDGRIIEQYIYNIVGYEATNGKPFAALKANIYLK